MWILACAGRHASMSEDAKKLCLSRQYVGDLGSWMENNKNPSLVNVLNDQDNAPQCLVSGTLSD